MTGYGKGEAQVDNVALTVEIKERQPPLADITVKLPRTPAGRGNEIRRQVGADAAAWQDRRLRHLRQTEETTWCRC